MSARARTYVRNNFLCMYVQYFDYIPLRREYNRIEKIGTMKKIARHIFVQGQIEFVTVVKFNSEIFRRQQL